MQILQFSEKGLEGVGYDHYVVCVFVCVLYVVPGIKHFWSYLMNPEYLSDLHTQDTYNLANQWN
jgi:hypothetical protein